MDLTPIPSPLPQQLPREVTDHIATTRLLLEAGDKRMDAIATQASDNHDALLRIELKLPLLQTREGCAAVVQTCAAQREASRLRLPGLLRSYLGVAIAAITLLLILVGLASNVLSVREAQRQLQDLSAITAKAEQPESFPGN